MLLSFLAAPLIVLSAGLFQSQYSLVLDLLSVSGKAIMFLLSVTGLGQLISFKIAHKGPLLERLLLDAVVGCSLLYAVSVLLALFGWFRPIPVILVVAAGAVAGLIGLRRRIAGADFRLAEWSSGEKVLLMVLLLLLGVQFVCGWTPLIYYDSLVYHFYAPAQFLRQGNLAEIPWNVYTNSPLALQLTLGTTLALDPGGSTLKLLITIMGWLMCAGAALFVCEEGRKPALLASLFVLSYPGFWVPGTLGAVDLPLAALTVLGAGWLRRAFRQDGGRMFLLGGSLALGFLLSSRYQGIITTIVIILCIVAESVFLKTHKARKLAVFVLCVFLMVLPWLIRNAANTGNPIYPVLYDVLGGSGWSQAQNAGLHRDVFGLSFVQVDFRQRILGLAGLLFLKRQNGWFGPVLLLGGLLAIGQSFNRTYRIAGLMGLSGILVWSVMHPVPDVVLVRFNAASVVFLMAATAGLLTAVRLRLLGFWGGLFVAILSLAAAIVELGKTIPVYSTVSNVQARIGFLRACIPGWDAFEYANAHLDPAKDRVLLIGETRGFLLKVPCLSPSPFNGPQVVSLFMPDSNPNLWFENLRRQGISHVLVCEPEWKHLRDKSFYCYFTIPDESIIHILGWLQEQKVLFNDRKGTVLLELKR